MKKIVPDPPRFPLIISPTLHDLCEPDVAAVCGGRLLGTRHPLDDCRYDHLKALALSMQCGHAHGAKTVSMPIRHALADM